VVRGAQKPVFKLGVDVILPQARISSIKIRLRTKKEIQQLYKGNRSAGSDDLGYGPVKAQAADFSAKDWRTSELKICGAGTI